MSESRPTSPRLAHAVLALGVTQIIGWGTTFYVPAVLAGAIAESFKVSPLIVLAAYSWSLLLSGLMSRRVGAWIDRAGAARVMALGSMVCALGLATHAAAPGLAVVWLAWTVLALSMRATLYDGAFAALTAMAGARARRAISLVTLFGGLASTLFWPISQMLLDDFGWRNTLWIYAALNLFICAPLHWRYAGASTRDRAERSGSNRSPETTPTPIPLTNALRRDAQRARAITLISAAFALHSLIWSAMATHLPGLLTGLGMSSGIAIAVAALMGPAQVVSRSAELVAQRWLSATALAVPVFAMQPVAFLLLGLGQSQLASAVVFVLLYGASNGLLTILRGALPLAILGPRDYGELLGRIAAPGLYVSAVAPVLFTQVLEAWGELAGVALMGVTGLGCTLIAWWLRTLAAHLTTPQP